jgi:vitamin B12 transporter
MTRYGTLLPLLCAAQLGLALSATSAASAESTKTDTSKGTPLETIVVTAHRMPGADPVLPVHVRDAERANAIGMEALRDLPSFAISQSGSLGSLTQVRVRGAEANHLLVLVDGIDVMDPTTDAGFNFANLNLAGISRIEYLPGAQSAVWGNHALAGVLHFTTEPTARIRRLTAESGSFDSGFGSLQVADATDAHYYNVSVSDFSTDGTNIARAGNETERYENTSWFASGGIHGENWTLRALNRRTWTTSDFDQTPYPSYLPVDGDAANTHDETLTAIGLDLRGSERPWQQRLTASLFETDNSTETDDARTASTNGRRWLVSSVTEIPFATRHGMILLLEHRDERFEQRGTADLFGDPNQRQEMDSTSGALEYVYRPGLRWRFSASGRRDLNSDFDDSDSVRLGASYQWRDDTLLWGAAGTGIKLPSFVERFGFTPDSFIGNPKLEAERNEHVSLGVEHQRGRWTHALTLFRDRLEDEINGFAFDPALGGFTSVNEDGTSHRQGVEWHSSLAWASGFLRIGANNLDTEDIDGSREIRRPEWQGFATLTQDWRRLRLDLGAFYVDEQIDLDFATWPAERVTLDAYTLAHGELSYELRPGTRLGLRGTNLLDETYEDILGYRAPGRAWYLKLGVDL